MLSLDLGRQINKCHLFKKKSKSIFIFPKLVTKCEVLRAGILPKIFH